MPQPNKSPVHEFQTGIGLDLIRHATNVALTNTKEELILVTCFWAESESRDAVRQLLLLLSDKVISDPKNHPRKIQVRICLSSVSFFQKIFHTSSPNGYVYPPSAWAKSLGLPRPDEVPGLEMQVKSIFMLPFSVMHPKYFIIDRRLALVPSCNVSWERWYEGCLNFEGQAVQDLYDHWSDFWGKESFGLSKNTPQSSISPNNHSNPPGLPEARSKIIDLKHQMASVTILPSPPHRNPHFRPFPWQAPIAAPKTPLNICTLRKIREANLTILMVTPNLTCESVISALKFALLNRVHVHVITNPRLMTLEQLVTAGTTTPQCIKRLVRWYKREDSDPEAAQPKGSLVIDYFKPRSDKPDGPVKSHLKLLVVDDEYLLVGSGNMDRASFHTSQELGVFVELPWVVQAVRDSVMDDLSHSLERVFES